MSLNIPNTTIIRKFDELVLRQNITSRIYDVLSRKTCQHIDVFLIECPQGYHYLVIEYRAGGRQLFETQCWLIHNSGTMEFMGYGYPTGYKIITIDQVRSVVTRRLIVEVYEREIFPNLSKRKHDMFKGYISRMVWFWPVSDCPDNPMEGIENLYYVSARYSNDISQMTPANRAVAEQAAKMNARAKRKQSPWTPAERSLLRTLDKIIRPREQK